MTCTQCNREAAEDEDVQETWSEVKFQHYDGRHELCPNCVDLLYSHLQEFFRVWPPPEWEDPANQQEIVFPRPKKPSA